MEDDHDEEYIVRGKQRLLNEIQGLGVPPLDGSPFIKGESCNCAFRVSEALIACFAAAAASLEHRIIMLLAIFAQTLLCIFVSRTQTRCVKS